MTQRETEIELAGRVLALADAGGMIQAGEALALPETAGKPRLHGATLWRHLAAELGCSEEAMDAAVENRATDDRSLSVGNGWSDGVVRGDRVVVCGVGPSAIVRNDDCDWAYADAAERAWHAALSAREQSEAWVASLDPARVSPGELDGDAAVRGYRVVSTGC